MIDSTTKKPVIAIQKDDRISIKIYSWGDLPKLEDYLEDKLHIEIDSFKSIKDENGKEIGSEIFFKTIHHIELIQNTIDELT
ncbi:MAG: hypothetical protein JRE10_12510 [Deltaproteobacteria bacterium]|nr:hypothetical protein [Deltaproteobacteria bacterium]